MGARGTRVYQAQKRWRSSVEVLLSKEIVVQTTYVSLIFQGHIWFIFLLGPYLRLPLQLCNIFFLDFLFLTAFLATTHLAQALLTVTSPGPLRNPSWCFSSGGSAVCPSFLALLISSVPSGEWQQETKRTSCWQTSAQRRSACFIFPQSSTVALLHLRMEMPQQQTAVRPVMAPARFSLKRNKRLFFILKVSLSKVPALTSAAASAVCQETLLLRSRALKNPCVPVTTKELPAAKWDPDFSKTSLKTLPWLWDLRSSLPVEFLPLWFRASF